MLWYKKAAQSINDTLAALKPQMAAAAQKIYNEWLQDDDDELAGGGICEQVANAIGDVLTESGLDVRTTESACGEEHVWIVVISDQEAFHVDIPFSIYEQYNGPYSFTKVDGVVFEPTDINIWPANPDEIVPKNHEKYEIAGFLVSGTICS